MGEAAGRVMWEVRSADGRGDELLAWVQARIDPDAELYASDGDQAFRLVVIAAKVDALADVPAWLVAREPQAWSFRRIER